MKRALFIHRSVGCNLLRDGRVRELLNTANPSILLDDYDQNIDVLTSQGVQTKPGFSFPGNDTKPQDYAAIFSTSVSNEHVPILKLALSYDVIAIKSCYPNSHITSDDQLEEIKGYYQSIASYFAIQPTKQLVILTSPPLVPFKTNTAAARRARALATWLATTNFSKNITVFNLFDLLAAPDSDLQANMLRREYRRWLPVDSHPNAKASQAVAPRFVECLLSVLAN